VTLKGSCFGPFVRILICGIALYVCAFAILLRNKSFDATDAVVVLIAFGIVFPLIAWIGTRQRNHAVATDILLRKCRMRSRVSYRKARLTLGGWKSEP
jgi:hypothetical protein